MENNLRLFLCFNLAGMTTNVTASEPMFTNNLPSLLSSSVTQNPINILLWLNVFVTIFFLSYQLYKKINRSLNKISLPPLSPASNDESKYCFKSTFLWSVSDRARFEVLMDEAISLVAPGYYYGDNMFVWQRNMSALSDAAFMQAWESNVRDNSDQTVLWRRYILCCIAYHCVQLKGDFVECGVLSGTCIKTIIDYFGKDNFHPRFWGYDTFDTNPTGHHFDNQGSGLFENIKKRFVDYPNVKLTMGLLPNSLVGNCPDKIAFLHIDLNSAEYEIAVLDKLFDKVVSGGVVILDDYEWSEPYAEQKKLEDPWFDARGYRVIPLPTGQGFIIKR